MSTISVFESNGWLVEGPLFNNHLIARGDEIALRFLFSIQFVKKWFQTHPSFALTMFHRPWKGVAKGKKLGIRFENVGPPVEGVFDVHDRGDGKSVSLVCHDRNLFEEILSRIAIPRTVNVTVFGNGIELARIALPHDRYFVMNYELFRKGKY